MLRLSPIDCRIGDYFPAPRGSHGQHFWNFVRADSPYWTFARVYLDSDSCPYVIPVFVRVD
jgi:hypothetical protein